MYARVAKIWLLFYNFQVGGAKVCHTLKVWHTYVREGGKNRIALFLISGRWREGVPHFRSVAHLCTRVWQTFARMISRNMVIRFVVIVFKRNQRKFFIFDSWIFSGKTSTT